MKFIAPTAEIYCNCSHHNGEIDEVSRFWQMSFQVALPFRMRKTIQCKSSNNQKLLLKGDLISLKAGFKSTLSIYCFHGLYPVGTYVNSLNNFLPHHGVQKKCCIWWPFFQLFWNLIQWHSDDWFRSAELFAVNFLVI